MPAPRISVTSSPMTETKPARLPSTTASLDQNRSTRGTVVLGALARDGVDASEIGMQHLGECDRAVRLPVRLEQRSPDAGPAQRRTVERVTHLGALATLRAVAHVGPTSLEVGVPR